MNNWTIIRRYKIKTFQIYQVYRILAKNGKLQDKFKYYKEK